MIRGLTLLLFTLLTTLHAFADGTTTCENNRTPQKPTTATAKLELVSEISTEFLSSLKTSRTDLENLKVQLSQIPNWPNASCKSLYENRGRCWFLNVYLPELISNFRLVVGLSSFDTQLHGDDYSQIDNALNPRLLSPTFSPLAGRRQSLSAEERKIAESVLTTFWDGNGQDQAGAIEDFIEILKFKIKNLSPGPSRALDINKDLLREFEATRRLNSPIERVRAAMMISDASSGRAWIDYKNKMLRQFHVQNLAELWSLLEAFGPLLYIRKENPTLNELFAAIDATIADKIKYAQLIQENLDRIKSLYQTISDFENAPITTAEEVTFRYLNESNFEDLVGWFLDHPTILGQTLHKRPEFCAIAIRGVTQTLEQAAQRDLALTIVILSPLLLLVPELAPAIGAVGTASIYGASALATLARGIVSYQKYDNRLSYYLARRKSLGLPISQMMYSETERGGTIVRAQREYLMTPLYLGISVGGVVPRLSELLRTIRP